MKTVDLIITRHKGLVEFLVNKGFDVKNSDVIAHVTDPRILDGKVVVGVLPVALAIRCETFIEVALNMPVEMRGKELTAEQTNEYCTGIFAYHFGRNFIDIETL